MNESNNTPRLKELGESNFEIVDGEPNIKGWDVKDASGKLFGEVDELIFNEETYKVLYLIVDLDDNDFDLEEDKKVLVPIGLAELHEKDDEVILPGITAAQLSALPAYEKGNITSQTESAIRTVFAGGAAAAAVTSLNEETTKQNFHQHENFNDTKFYGKRQPNIADTTAIPIIEEKMEVGKREVETGGVRLKSRVVQESVEENVNLRSEHVRVEQMPVNRPATAADLEAFKEGTIEMKEYAEIPVVTKEAFVTGEVSLEKEVEETNQTVEGTIRKTEVETENFTEEADKLATDKDKLTGNEGSSFYK
ncbi:MAG: DUF2382 domain-containing protein [Janthinobacterium lividum]